MGVLWIVLPLDAPIREWLAKKEVEHPETDSRLPTGKEIKSALAELEGYNIKIIDNGILGPWQAWIESKCLSDAEPDEWTVLNIHSYTGDDLPQELSFEKGHDTLIRRVLAVFAMKCGPLVLIPDTGDKPEVVGSRDNPT